MRPLHHRPHLFPRTGYARGRTGPSREARGDPGAGGGRRTASSRDKTGPTDGSARSPALFERAQEAGPFAKAHRDPAAGRALGKGGHLSRACPGARAYLFPQHPVGRGPGWTHQGADGADHGPPGPRAAPHARTHQGAAGAGHGPPGPGPLPTRSAPGARPSLSQWDARVPRPRRHHNNPPRRRRVFRALRSLTGGDNCYSHAS